MSPEIIGVIAIIVLFAALAAGMQIGIAMAVVGFAGFGVIVNFSAALGMLKTVPYTTAASYTMGVVPLFILMGQMAYYSKLSNDAYYAIYKWLGHLPGGLAIATIGGSAIFAAICGSSTAAAGTMTVVALPQMDKYRYHPSLSLGSIAAGGTLGILIPPSVALIIYGIISEQSISRLFIAGIIPGIVLSLLFCITIYFWARLRPSIGPRGPRFGWRERLAGVRHVWEVAILAFAVLGGIWGGVFSPTEAGGIGACGAFLIALKRRQLNLKRTLSALRETIKISGMIFTILIGAMIFNYFLSVSRLPMAVADLLSRLPFSPMGILITILFVYIILGCAMDTLAMTVLTLPIFLPLITNLGFDLIWFGVIFTVICEMALITPPIGLNVFIVGGMVKSRVTTTKEIQFSTIFRGVVPFIIAMLICVIILLVFPQISLFLPNTMLGGG